MLFDRNNKSQYALFEKRILNPFLVDTYVKNVFSKFTSSTNTGIIWDVKGEREKGAGETATFKMFQYFDADEKYDDEQAEGTGQYNLPVSDTLRLGETRFVVATEGKLLAEIQVNVDLDKQLRDDLHIKSQLLQTRRIINQFAFCFDNQTIMYGSNHRSYGFAANSQGTSAFSRYFNDRVLNCTIDQDSNSISSDRVVIGNDNLGAVPNTVRLAIANANIGANDPTAANSGNLTVRHIEKLVRVANLGGRKANSEQLIKPYKAMSAFGFDNSNYVLFVSPTVAATLRQDPNWTSQVNRGCVEIKQQPSLFYNSPYVGSVYNVDIICIPEFEHLTFTNADGVKVGYSALCGQSAIVTSRGMKPMFTEQNTDHNKKCELGVTMIDGMKPLKFLAKNPTNKALNIPVERGIIHSFTTIL